MALTGGEGGDGRLGGGAGSDVRRSLHVHRLVDVLVHLPDRNQLRFLKNRRHSGFPSITVPCSYQRCGSESVSLCFWASRIRIR
jgi:hypothetical protein